MSLLRCVGLRKVFPGVVALDGVDLEVHPGSVHALVGENGAGKSTLVKILSGAQRPDGGRIHIDGHPVDIRNARQAQRLGISIVYQEFNLVADLAVSENIFLGRWPRRLRMVDFSELHRRAEGLLQSLGLSLPVRRAVRGLSVAQQQMVEIAKALSLEARVLILDEPSAVLTNRELQALFELVRALRDRGVAVIYISHRLEEIFDLADTVTVLRDGQHISTRPIAEVTRERLISEMVGRELAEEFPPRDVSVGEVVLSARGFGARGRFEPLDLDVRAGEVLAVAGLVGAGRTSLLKALFGAIAVSSGTLDVAGVSGPFRNPRQAMAAGLACLPEDRKKEGLLLEHSVRDNISLADLRACSRAGFMQPARERADTVRYMRDLHIKARGPAAAVNTLSGGNQQKVLLARWMKRPHRVILFDEPTRGIDVGAKFEIYSLINRLAGEGVGVIMVSSELPEIIGMADRIAVMHEGRLTGTLNNTQRQTTQQQIMELAAR